MAAECQDPKENGTSNWPSFVPNDTPLSESSPSNTRGEEEDQNEPLISPGSFQEDQNEPLMSPGSSHEDNSTDQLDSKEFVTASETTLKDFSLGQEVDLMSSSDSLKVGAGQLLSSASAPTMTSMDTNKTVGPSPTSFSSKRSKQKKIGLAINFKGALASPIQAKNEKDQKGDILASSNRLAMPPLQDCEDSS